MKNQINSPRAGWSVRGIRRFMRSRRRVLLIPGGLILAGIMAVSAVSSSQHSTVEGKTRLDWFQDEAPASFSFFSSLWGRGADVEDEAALALITEEVTAEFYRSIPFGEIIHAKAKKYEVDPALVAAVVEVESDFRLEAESSRGALGLMQLRPSTGRWMGARNLFDPGQNIDAGTRYLKYLEERFDGDLSRQLAAYNAGEGTVSRYGGVPPYPETRSYIRKVLERYERRNSELDRFHRQQLERGRDGK